MLDISGVDLNYGSKRILSDIKLSIHTGDTIALVGESGCGKSTLISHIYSLLENDIALCPQEAGLVEPLSAFHNIYAGTLNTHSFLYNLRNLIYPMSKEFAKAEELAQTLGIKECLKLSIDKLSGGQAQRVNIARAMIQNCSIFLGDEPVSSVDDYHKIKLINEIKTRFETCIFALHDLDIALASCDRIVGLHAGRIAFDCLVKDLTKEQLTLIYQYHDAPAVNEFKKIPSEST